MKYYVKHSCGHEQCVELFGKNGERERKINYFEKYGVCSECYAEQKRIAAEAAAEKQGLKETEMSYREYKLNYSECKTVPGSYDGETKTIKVYC